MTDQIEEVATGCSMDRVIRLLSGEWTTHVLWRLSENGPTRFGVLRRDLRPISAKVLTAKLRHLESAGLVCRSEEDTVPPQVTYELTDVGLKIDKLLKAFADFAHALDASPTFAPKASLDEEPRRRGG